MNRSHSQGKPFNITVIQVYAQTSNTEEAEVERFYSPIFSFKAEDRPCHQRGPQRGPPPYGRGLQCCVGRVPAVVPGRRATSHARKPCPFPFSPQAEKGRGQARGPRSWRRCCLSRLQVAALGSWPLRQLGRHSVLGSSLLFHVSRKSSWAVAGPGPGLLNLSPLPVRC